MVFGDSLAGLSRVLTGPGRENRCHRLQSCNGHEWGGPRRLGSPGEFFSLSRSVISSCFALSIWEGKLEFLLFARGFVWRFCCEKSEWLSRGGSSFLRGLFEDHSLGPLFSYAAWWANLQLALCIG